MKNLIIFFRYQSLFLLGLIFFILAPFYLSSLYLPEIPYKQYFFLLVIVILKLIVIDEKIYHGKIKEKVAKDLAREMKKNPSRDALFKRTTQVSKGRDISLLAVGLILIISGIILQA